MHEEDRARALELYGDIFDEIGNDTAVLQLLVSPTRQAVNLARAYDAKDHNGQIGEPAYLGVIEELRRQAGSLFPAVPKVDESQISLFTSEQEPESEPERHENVFESFDFESFDGETEEEAPEELPEGVSRYPDEDSEEAAVLPPPVPVLPQDEPQEKRAGEEIDEFADSVAAFLADFPVSAESTEKEEPPAAGQAQRAPAEAKPAQEAPRAEQAQELPKQTAPENILPNLPEIREEKPVVGLLILFILLAVPVGLLGIGLLLAAGLLALGLAAAAISVGIYGLVTAFTSFSVFADILLVFGLSLAITALGLLLFWVFIWLLFGVIPDLVRGLCRLGRRLCYKEVTL